LGHHIVGEAANGNQAVELARKLNPEVILLDLVLPQKNGVQVAREIIEILPMVKIVAVSTLPRADFEARALEAGCCAYMSKPFSKRDVAMIFESLATPQRMVQNG
jgi:YesN/AraC family two-component response regulator